MDYILLRQNWDKEGQTTSMSDLGTRRHVSAKDTTQGRVKWLGPGPLQNLEEAWNVSHSEHNWGIEVVGGKRGAVSNQGGVWNQLKPLWNWRSELVLEWQLLLQVSPKVSWAGWEHWDYRSAENESGALFKIVQSNEWFCTTWGWEAARELLN